MSNVIFGVERPADDRWRIGTGRAALAFSSPWSDFASGAPGAFGDELPAVVGVARNAGIVAASDVRNVVTGDDVEVLIFLTRIECAAEARRAAVEAIAASARQ